MHRFTSTRILAALILPLAWSAAAHGQTIHKVPTASGAALAPDQNTVIVTATKLGMLVYFDLVTEKESKRVEVEFQPERIAVQGDQLFVSAKGTGTVHVLDAATGKELKQLQIPQGPIENLACHRHKGLLYVTNKADEVFSLDPTTGKATKTKARGQKLVVDPVAGKFVYTGIQRPIRDVLVVREGPGDTLKISLDRAGEFAMLLKFAVEGGELKPVAVNDNAASNGRSLAISPDGSKVAMAGGGGWRAKTDPRRNYCIAVFETKDLKTFSGQIDLGAYPLALAWHPHLNLGVALKTGGDEMVLFNSKSYVEKQRHKSVAHDPAAILFGAGGTKVAIISPTGSITPGPEAFLQVFTLPLTDADRETLKKANAKSP